MARVAVIERLIGNLSAGPAGVHSKIMDCANGQTFSPVHLLLNHNCDYDESGRNVQSTK